MSHNCFTCGNPAMGRYSRLSFCKDHRPYAGRPVNIDDVIEARERQDEGDDLKTIAASLNLLTADLDLALWNHFGQALKPVRYVADFVA